MTAKAELRHRVLEATDSVRKGLDRAMDRTALTPAMDLWEHETAIIGKQMRRHLRGKLRQEVDPASQRALSGYLSKKVQTLTRAVESVITHGTRGSLVDGIGASSKFLYRVLGKATPIDDPVAVNRIIRRHLVSEKALREKAMTGMTRGMVTQLQGIVGVRAASAPTIGELIEGVEVSLEQQWWRVERIVATETSRAYNAAQSEALNLAATEVHGLHQRWTERISDATGKPMDRRVAPDSVAMHGQVALPGRMFHMPDDAPGTRIRGAWPYPPNRPHDRAVVTPWLPEWGMPAWVCQAGQRIPL